MSDMGWENIKKCYQNPNCVLDESDLEDVIHYAMQFEKRIAKLEAALQHFYDYGYDRGRCEEALQEVDDG